MAAFVIVVAALVVVVAALIVVVAGLAVEATGAASTTADAAPSLAGPALALTYAATLLASRREGTSTALSVEMKLVVDPPVSLPLAESTLFARQARPRGEEHALPALVTKVPTVAAWSVAG